MASIPLPTALAKGSPVAAGAGADISDDGGATALEVRLDAGLTLSCVSGFLSAMLSNESPVAACAFPAFIVGPTGVPVPCSSMASRESKPILRAMCSRSASCAWLTMRSLFETWIGSPVCCTFAGMLSLVGVPGPLILPPLPYTALPPRMPPLGLGVPVSGGTCAMEPPLA